MRADRFYAQAFYPLAHRIYLHAYLLYFVHPRDGRVVEVVAPLLSDMSEYIKKNFNKDKEYDKLSKDEIKSYFENSNS